MVRVLGLFVKGGHLLPSLGENGRRLGTFGKGLPRHPSLSEDGNGLRSLAFRHLVKMVIGFGLLGNGVGFFRH